MKSKNLKTLIYAAPEIAQWWQEAQKRRQHQQWVINITFVGLMVLGLGWQIGWHFALHDAPELTSLLVISVPLVLLGLCFLYAHKWPWEGAWDQAEKQFTEQFPWMGHISIGNYTPMRVTQQQCDIIVQHILKASPSDHNAVQKLHNLELPHFWWASIQEHLTNTQWGISVEHHTLQKLIHSAPDVEAWLNANKLRVDTWGYSFVVLVALGVAGVMGMGWMGAMGLLGGLTETGSYNPIMAFWGLSGFVVSIVLTQRIKAPKMFQCGELTVVSSHAYPQESKNKTILKYMLLRDPQMVNLADKLRQINYMDLPSAWWERFDQSLDIALKEQKAI